MADQARKTNRFYIIVVLVITAVTVISYSGVVKPIKIGRQNLPNKCLDQEFNISFEYPTDFETRATSQGDGRLVGVFPKIFKDQTDPRVIEIAYEKDLNPSIPLINLVLTVFPGKRRGDLKQIKSYKIEGYETQVREGGSTILYSYYRANGNIYMIKFEESYYTSENALVPVNNRPYISAYYMVLNSLKFDNTPS